MRKKLQERGADNYIRTLYGVGYRLSTELSPPMNLLTATTRYYLLLTTGLFVVASALLYAGLPRVLRHETDEQLLSERLTLQRRVASGRALPTDLLFAYQLARSPQPRRLGYSDTLLLDEREQELVPFRQLRYRARPRVADAVSVSGRAPRPAAGAARSANRDPGCTPARGGGAEPLGGAAALAAL